MTGTTSRNAVVVVGAGVAGLRAVETLRSLDYQGDIVLLSAESEEPYSLPPLSKELLTGALDESDIRLRSFDELDALGVQVVFNSAAVALDTTDRVVHTNRGAISFDRLVVATGSAAKYPSSWPALSGVMSLRTLDDARRIARILRNDKPRVVVIGGGFIGCEIASAARYFDLDTTIVEYAEHPMARALQSSLAEPIVRLHRQRGVRVQCKTAVRRVLGNGYVKAVDLDSGERVPADLVVVGIGARPAVEWLSGSLTLGDGVLTDSTLQTSVPGIYAAGDIARFPTGNGATSRVEHWTNAKNQGGLAARNLLNPDLAEPFAGVPYVWSDQYGHRLQIVGETQSGRPHFLMGNAQTDSYLAAIVADDIVIGGVGFGVGKPFAKLRRHVGKQSPWADVDAELGDGDDALRGSQGAC